MTVLMKTLKPICDLKLAEDMKLKEENNNNNNNNNNNSITVEETVDFINDSIIYTSENLSRGIKDLGIFYCVCVLF